MIALLFERDPLFLEPAAQFLVRQNRIDHAAALLRFIFFGDAGSDKDRLRVRESVFNVLAVRVHGRRHVGKIRKRTRIMLLDQKIDRMAARRDQHVVRAAVDHSLVFRLNRRRADGRLLRVGKAERFQRSSHFLDTDAVVIGDEGRGDARIDGQTHLDHDANAFCVVGDLLGILRADDETLAAKNALVGNDVRLVGGKADRLDRAVADALITVLAVGSFEFQAFCHNKTSVVWHKAVGEESPPPRHWDSI